MTDSIRRKPLFLASCAGMFMFGLVLALLGTLFGLPEMRERLHVSLAQQGNLFLILYLGILVANLIAGPAIDRLGHRAVLLASSLLAAMALVGFAMAQGFWLAAASSLLLGMGGAGLNTATTALVSHLFGEARGSMLSYLGIAFGIGALFIPLAASTLARHFSIVDLLLISALLAALCVVPYSLLRFPEAREAGHLTLLENWRVARYPGVLLFAFVLFLQSGNEAAIAGWTSTYLGTRGASAEIATRILAVYWAAMITGRALAGYLLRRFSNEKIILGSAVSSMAGCAVLYAAPSIPMMTAAVVLVGLCFASIFPATLGLAGDRYPHSAGTVFGLLFSVAVLGGMTFPWAMGHIGQAFGVRPGMILPIAGTAGIALLIRSISRRQPNP